MRQTATISAQSISYPLPQTKTDRFGHGMQLVITASTRPNNCVALFTHYLVERDTRFPHHPELWLRCDGSIPTRSWFLRQLCRLIPDPTIGSNSMRAGGATALTLAGAPPHIIQAAGRWSSDEFHKYVRRHLFLLQALLHKAKAEAA
jgi:hypothetical protein